MAPLRTDDDLSRTAATEPTPLDVSAALAFVTSLPSPRTFRTQAYVPRHSFSILNGRPVSHMPALPERKRRGGLGARLDAFRQGVEQQLHGLQQTAAETLQNVQNAAKEVFVDLGLIEKEGVVEEETVPEWYEDDAFKVETMEPIYNPLASGHFAAILPGDGVAEMVATTSILNFLNIYNTLLIGRLVLTWFPNPPEIIANPLSTICDPYLNLFRGIIPPIGGTIDLSPVLAFLALNVFTNAAQALPAEIPPGSNEPVYTAPATTEDNVSKAPARKQGPRNLKGLFKIYK
eukprot:TRINITY_DN17965_c0_g1_i1.p1 TRINITY_DN17965_c0_g1~~TRINITY_DN17965_c0_g1_i1.p1  ORF type:complete len:309 (+),score=48.68 TRINITY_DN17965_c0_g1_i1:58-927(+)